MRFQITRVLLSAALAAACAWGQTFTATLSGTITDPQKSVIPDATISVLSNDSGVKKSAKTDKEGRYNVPFLPAGEYTVTVEASGFQTSVRKEVRLEVAQAATIDVALNLANVAQSVEVIAETLPLLSTDTGGLETTLESKLIMDIPSAERNTLALINTLPGVMDVGFSLAQGENLNTNGNAQGPVGSPGNRNFFDTNFGVSGGQASSNDVLLDGVSDTVGDFNGVAVTPPQDSVQEFKVMSGSYSAEFGRTGGGVVNFVTKAGGQKFHGSIYDYFQNGGLNANGWQRNRQGYANDGKTPKLPRIPIKRNQFGGSIGGPVIAPKIGRLKNTFFFFNYEGRREANPYSRTLTMPTAKMRTGDFSELLTGAIRTNVPVNQDGSPALLGQLYNPYGALVQNPNGQNVRATIPGNRLDLLPKCGSGPRTAPCLDSVAFAALKYLPLPNQPGLADNYLYSGTAEFSRDIEAARIDRVMSEKHSLFGRFSIEKRRQAEPSYLGTIASNSRVVKDVFFNGTFNDVYMLTPWAINNARYGYTRARARQVPFSQEANFDPTTLGFPSYIAAAANVLQFPAFTFSGGSESQGQAGEITSGNVFGPTGGNNQPRDTQTMADSLTMFHGKHSLKAGVEYRLLRFFANQNTNPIGSYSFNRNFTRGPVPTNTPANVQETGSSFAAFLMGMPSGATIASVIPLTLYHHYGAMYIQDDWKPTRRLTLNLGFRWDVESGTGESHGQLAVLDRTAKSPLAGKVGMPDDPIAAALLPNYTDLRGLLTFPDGPQQNTNWRRFAPRFGFAYRVNENTVLRGGYGLSYVPQSVEQTNAIGVNFTTSSSQGTDSNGQVVQPGGTQTPTFYLTDPFRYGIQPPPGTSQGAYTSLGQSPTLPDANRRVSYVQQYNVMIQRLLPKRFVMDIGYVGSHGVRLPFPNMNLNQLPPWVLDFARDNWRSGRDVNGNAATSVTNFLQQQVNNPLYGIITDPTSALAAKTFGRARLFYAYQQYNSVVSYRPLIGMNKYNALQVTVRKTYSNGLSAMSSFAFSKAIDLGGAGNNSGGFGGTTVQDIYNLRGSYSLSSFDIPFRLTSVFSYDLPFGRGKRFGRSFSGFTQKLIGGWQTSGNILWQTGAPVTITAPGIGYNFAVRYADRIYGVPAQISGDEMRANIRAGKFAFDPAAYAQPADNMLGNSARNQTDVRRDSYKNASLSVLKNFTLWNERVKSQLRGEFLNAFNMVVFGTPGTDVSNRDVVQNGVIVSRGTFARVTTQGNQPRTIQLVLRFTF